MQDRADSGQPRILDRLALVDRAGWAGVYALTLTVLGFWLGGAGHGLITPLCVGVSGLIVWPIAAAATGRAQRPLGRAVFVVAMSLGYVVIATVWIKSGDRDDINHVWAVTRWVVILFIGLYLAGQAVLLRAFARRAF